MKSEMRFFATEAKLTFAKLRNSFSIALILYCFDLECHIWIETNVSSYAIVGIFNQLTLDNLDRWYPIAFFSQKMILAKTQYKTYDGKLLVIAGALKT